MSLDSPNFDKGAQPRWENQFRFLLNVLADRWRMHLVTALAGCLLWGGAAWWMYEPGVDTYQAIADINIQPPDRALYSQPGLISFDAEPAALVEQVGEHNVAEAVAHALVARGLASGGPLGAVTTPEEMAAAIDDIGAKLSIQALQDRVHIRIMAERCRSAQEATEIADAALRYFLAQSTASLTEAGENQYQAILDDLEDTREALYKAEQAEWTYKEREGFGNYANVGAELANTYDELKKLRIKRELTDSRLTEIEGELAHNNNLLPAALGQVPDDVVQGLFDELNDLLREQLTLRTVYTDRHPKLIELNDLIQEKQQAILAANKKLGEGEPGGSDLWRRRQQLYGQQIDLRMQLAGMEIQEATLERTLQEMVPKIPELASRSLEFEELEGETRRLREQFNKQTDRKWEIRKALDRGVSRLERLNIAATRIPAPMGGTQVWVNCVIGALAGFVFSFCFALMMEANDTSIRSIEDVNQYIGLEVIGTIPKMRFGSPRRWSNRRRLATYVTTVDEEQIDACIVTQHDPKSPISEAYRTLRTNFQFATLKLKPRTVMVTSAVPGEGKTTTAANLAVTMADRGMRVLMVDTDLRRPNVHRVMRMERGPGLADVLREGLDHHTVIRPTRVENLSIISSGRVPPNPSELMGSERMAELMKQLGQEFDLVICDAPSVLVVTDPVLLATHVDCCIAVVSTKNARRETVIRAKKLLEAANVTMAGVVVNGLESTRRHYYYYYYYYDDGAPSRRKWYHFQ